MARIYLVTHGTSRTLVRAETVNGAVRHIADRDIRAALATQDEMLDLGKAGAVVEDAAAKPAPKEAERLVPRAVNG